VRSKTIVIAYQDDSWVKDLSNSLDGTGFRIESTRIVSEVIRKVRGRDAYVVLLDDRMEEIKACDLVPLFKRINPRVQIIVISAEEPIGWVKRLRDGGIFYQAMKPVDLEEIRSAVACAFDKIEREQPREAFVPFLIPGSVPA
jgi:DNA-binding NtrC family response regulator